LPQYYQSKELKEKVLAVSGISHYTRNSHAEDIARISLAIMLRKLGSSNEDFGEI
jgi:hypothetical protein